MQLLCSTPPSPCSPPFMWLLLLSSQLSRPRVALMVLALRLMQGQLPKVWFTLLPTSGLSLPCAIMQLFVCLFMGCLLSSVHASVRAEAASTLRATWRSLAPGQNLCVIFLGQTIGTYKDRPGRPDRGKLSSPHQTLCTALHCSWKGCHNQGLGLPGQSSCYSQPYS